ncbi:MAG: hypothetical protein Q4C42_11760 [Clostridia bacterium]|nr:hypothetical protein [Clostridia bacterium]
MRYKFVIPGRLPGLNEFIDANRKNAKMGNNMKQQAQAKVGVFIRYGLKQAKIRRRVNMTYIWYEEDRRRDKDNISSFGRKVIQDALVKNGYLENDGWKQIGNIRDFYEVDRDNPRIVVILEEEEMTGKEEIEKIAGLIRRLEFAHEGVMYDTDGCDEELITSGDIMLMKSALAAYMEVIAERWNQ